MSEAKESAPVLIVARSPRLRREYATRLAARWQVLPLGPEELRDPTLLVDASGALVVLEEDGAMATLEACGALSALSAGRAVVLVRDGVEEPALSEALHRLAPRQVLDHPTPDALLHWALDRSVLRQSPAAREQQRPARALLGVSSAIRRLTDEIDRIATSNLSVLILGETGTGKELVARAVHEKSRRARNRFLAINCGALPEALLEGELFGHRRGAFTGATRDHRGLFEQAHGGTLFLDEVGEMSPALQVKLLRVLETGEVRPLGATDVVSAQVRVVSATHSDLQDAIEEGSFRQDLFFRLDGATLQVPPLRRRRVDIPFLAQHFAEEFGAESAKRITISDDFLDALSQRDFPGNVRELRNTVERAIALARDGEPVTADDLAPDSGGRPVFYAMGTLKDRIAQVEIQAIQESLERYDGNKTRAAEALGISRLGLRNKMQRLGLS